MRFLVDENLGAGLVKRLFELGHDAVSVATVAPGSTDDDILAIARRETRIVITEDKDFGEMIFRRGLAHAGIILLRLRRSRPQDVRTAVEGLLATAADRLPGRFVVVREGRVRIR